MNQIAKNTKVTYLVTRKTPSGVETIKRTGIVKGTRDGKVIVEHCHTYTELVDANKLTAA